MLVSSATKDVRWPSPNAKILQISKTYRHWWVLWCAHPLIDKVCNVPSTAPRTERHDLPLVDQRTRHMARYEIGASKICRTDSWSLSPPLLVEKEWLPFDTPPTTSAETCGEALIRNPIRLEVNGASHSIRLSLCRKQLVTACFEHNVTNILPHRNPTQGNNNKIESKLKNTHRNLGQRGWRRSRR